MKTCNRKSNEAPQNSIICLCKFNACTDQTVDDEKLGVECVVLGEEGRHQVGEGGQGLGHHHCLHSLPLQAGELFVILSSVLNMQKQSEQLCSKCRIFMLEVG